MKTRPLCLTFFFAATIVESSFSNGTLGLDGFQEFLLSAQDRFGDGGGLLHVEMPHQQDQITLEDSVVSWQVAVLNRARAEVQFAPLESHGGEGEITDGGVHLFPKAIPVTSHLNTDVWFFSAETSAALEPEAGESTQLRLDSRVYTYEPSVQGLRIHEIYGVKGKFKRNDDIGEWNTDGGLRFFQSDEDGVGGVGGGVSPYSTRSDLSGVRLRATVMDYSPLCNDPDDDNSVTGVSGALSDSLNAVAERLRVGVDFSMPPDRNWGALDDQGKWNGMVGRLVSGEADLTGVVLSITTERSEVVSYSVPMFRDKLTLMQIRRSGVSVNFLAYIDVFTGEAWTAMLVYLFVLAVAMAAVAARGGGGEAKKALSVRRRSGEEYYSSSTVDRVHRALTVLPRYLALVWLSLLQRDTPSSSTSGRPFRVVYVSTCLAAFVLFAYYNAVLTSLMTISTYSNPIRSFADVLRLDYYAIAERDSADSDKLRFAPQGTNLQRLHQRAVDKDAFYDDNADAVKQAAASWKNLLLGSKLVIGALDKRLVSLDIDDPIIDDLAFAFPKDSEFRGIFDHFINKLKEGGSLSWSERRWLGEGNSDGGGGSESKSDSSSSSVAAFVLGYDNVLFPFLVVCTGISGAALLALVERAAAAAAAAAAACRSEMGIATRKKRKKRRNRKRRAEERRPINFWGMGDL